MQTKLPLLLAALLGLLPALAPAAPAAHPQLLFTPGRLAELKTRAASDPVLALTLDRIHQDAEICLHLPPLKNEHTNAQRNLLAVSRAALARICTCAFEFRLSGDKRFLDHARQDMLDVVAFVDWDQGHFLSTAEMAAAVGLGYDWTYPELSPEDRKTIHDGLVARALKYVPAAYGLTTSDENIWLAKGKGDTATNNWNQVCNSGLLIAAAAVREEDPETFRVVVNGLRESLPHSLDAYEPDGATPEGPIYWSYGMNYTALLMQILRDTEGTDYHLLDTPRLNRTALLHYFLNVFGPSGQAFNYADCDPGPVWENNITGTAPGFEWLAAQPDAPPTAAHAARARLETWLRNYNSPGPDRIRLLVFNALWLPTAPSAPGAELPLAAHFRGVADLAFLRGSWTDRQSLWVGLKGGTNGKYGHAQFDLGTFVLDANNVRWAVDLGSDSYVLPHYWGVDRPKYFRCNNFGHNTLTIDDTVQALHATAPVVRCEGDRNRSLAVVDLTAAYPGKTRSLRRGAYLAGGRTVLIQDEAAGMAAGSVADWRMFTQGKIAVSADGRSAELTQDNKTLHATVLAPAGARFAVGSVKPPTEAENQNTGFQMLELKTSAAPDGNLRLAVLLSPTPPGGSAPAVVPLDQWK